MPTTFWVRVKDETDQFIHEQIIKTMAAPAYCANCGHADVLHLTDPELPGGEPNPRCLVGGCNCQEFKSQPGGTNVERSSDR